MNSITNLLILFGGILVLNTVLSAMLLWKQRTRLHRAVLYLWATSVINFVAQGAFFEGTHLQIIIGFAFIFGPTLSLANLLASLVDQPVPWRRYVAILGGGLAVSVGLELAGFEFWMASFPLMLAIIFPAVHTLFSYYIAGFKTLTFTGKGLVISTVFYILHTADYPFLRLEADLAAVGFTIGLLAIFALSIFAPAVVLEIVTGKEARNSAEMDVARRIQTNILPKNPEIAGHELVCYMKPAEEVGGDYYDVFTLGDFNWILMGDVTGHGLRSGLVMLMAQSIMRSIVQARHDITPQELNSLANQVLYENLQRLDEHRTMTIVSFSCKADGDEFAFNGAHDDVYIWRADTRQVDVIEVGHFPLGLGLMKDVQPMMRPETRVQLAEGDLLFLGTDGITEAAAGGDYMKGMFEEEGLVNFLSKNGHLPLEEIKVALVEEMNNFTQGVFHDDVTFMMLRKTPS